MKFLSKMSAYAFLLAKYGEIILVRKSDYNFVFTPDRSKVLLASTIPIEIYIEDEIPEELKEKAYEILNDPKSKLLKLKYDGETIIIEEFSHDGKLIFSHKFDGKTIESLVYVNNKEYKVIEEIKRETKYLIELDLKFDDAYTDEEKDMIKSELWESPLGYVFMKDEIEKYKKELAEVSK